MRAVIALLLVLGLAGCSAKAPQFSHTSATQQTYMQDRYACIQQSQTSRSSTYVNGYGGSQEAGTYVSRGLFMNCMAAKGYSADPNGRLITPAANIVTMVD
jgi:Tfp pilus assembly protein PilV